MYIYLYILLKKHCIWTNAQCRNAKCKHTFGLYGEDLSATFCKFCCTSINRVRTERVYSNILHQTGKKITTSNDSVSISIYICT